MKYTKQEKLDIGRRIYDSEITRYQAAELYKIAKVQHALICVCTEMQITCLQKIVNNKNLI